jgi:S-(hydroxymethyl)glutathione dehydrogenase/alcohol dehydrogenase
MPDETFRFHDGTEDVGGMCMLGTFSQYATVSEFSCVKVDDDVPLETAVLIGCGVPTGWGTAIHAGGIEPGDTTVIYGIGGIGINAVQGAAYAGAANVVVVDPLEYKRTTAKQLGATHAFATAEEAQAAIIEATRGVGADQALVTVGVVDEDVVSSAFSAIRKGGTVIVTGLADPAKKTVHVSGGELTLFEKRIHGSLFGSGNPFHDIPRMVALYKEGHLKLDEIITRRYSLDEVNQGYQDLLDGKNMRGVIVHEH